MKGERGRMREKLGREQVVSGRRMGSLFREMACAFPLLCSVMVTRAL